MKFFIIALCIFADLAAQMDEKYCVSFGLKDAPIKVVQYYSLICPHCVTLFKEDFTTILEKYIAPGYVEYTRVGRDSCRMRRNPVDP